MAFVEAAGNSIPVAGPKMEQAFPTNVNPNDTIVVFCCHDSTATDVSIVDTLLNTYTPALENFVYAPNVERLSLYVAQSASGGANTVTINTSVLPGDGTIIIARFSGRNTANPAGNHTNGQQATPGVGANGVICGPITALLGDDVAMFMVDVGAIRAGAFTNGTGFTEKLEVGSGGGAQLDAMFQCAENVAAGAITGLATVAFNEAVLSAIVCLKAAVSTNQVLLAETGRRILLESNKYLLTN